MRSPWSARLTSQLHNAMITEVALITVSCVLFVQMGLSRVIEGILHLRFIVLSCPKCLTMWFCLFYLVLNNYSPLLSIATSFIASYCALWLSLFYDAVAIFYNYLYEQITQTQDASEDAERSESSTDAQADSNEVSTMQ